MGKFEDEYKKLNRQQRQAVDTTEGPVLVIAGPGTGKTQLLSMRAANILRQNDLSPGNILCLTFTDNAARNMRERLAGIIGQPAYHVAIYTFHSFGADIINHYPDYFTGRQLLQQIDELGQYELLRGIFEQLPHSNPLSTKVGDNYVFLKNALNTIGWLKQNAVAPNELHELLAANQKFIEEITSEISECFATTPSPKQLAAYNQLLKSVQKHVTGQRYFGFPEYAAECAAELEQAINDTPADGRYAKAITAWRNAWCKKDMGGQHVFKDGGQNYRKMQALANVYQKLLEAMSQQGLYDFDDMVVEAVHAMERDDELRFNLQERYQYVLVDEFQDTNKAQLRMLTALGDNPVHEGKPNIMAVGDDDQAIYSFQGAEVSNMAAFIKQYGVKPILLNDNYRSTPDILEAGTAIAEQITDRLDTVVPDVKKRLAAQRQHNVNVLDHLSFASELAQYDWIAEEIAKLIKKGLMPEAIAVIAPRHKYLERLMPYLGNRHIPVAYERRENILEAPIIIELLTMAELVVTIAENRQQDVDALISQVLGYDFWSIYPETLIQISLGCYESHKHWLEVLAKHKDERLREITAWFVRLAKQSSREPMEYILDELIGTDGGLSPMRSYYFSEERYEQATDMYLTLLGQLSTLRQRLRQWKPLRTLYVKDLVKFSQLHLEANLKIVDTNPHTQTTSAVQVMTAYKAKGLEFDAVFVINAQDEVWGPTARSQSSRITLPRNLPIEPAGESDNDRLRLLFVALTRAKHTLHVTSYTHTMENKPSPGLSFILGGDGTSVHESLRPQVIDEPATLAAVEILTTDWAYRFRQVIADKPALFEPILANYKLSVTHLNNFLDVREGGPQYFLVHNLLRFPKAPTPSAAYGDAVHKTLQYAHNELKAHGQLPAIGKLQKYFSDLLERKHLRQTDQKRLDRRGQDTLKLYIEQRGKQLLAGDLIERGFNNEGVVVAGARLSGKLDKISLAGQGVRVTDFKTGKPAVSWQGKDEFQKARLHKYRQQLYFYKLLVEGSASFARKVAVSTGALEFIESDEHGRLVDDLELVFDGQELERFVKLIGAVWAHITGLDFPDVSGYPANSRGISQFEADLIAGKI